MKRTKTPVLTSPWKIGFFVSLMLVFVSIGVTYFFARRFGVTWNVLDRNWFDQNEWLGIVRGEGFLFELLPLIGLVAVTSGIAYLVITGAVRKYKRFLDSGCDYRNLLSSLKDLDDLEDKRKIERIRNHPELKRLLLGLAETFEGRERLLSEREGALETRLQDALQAKETALVEGFVQECERLAKAVESGAVEPSAIEYSNPGLRRIGEVFAHRSLRAQQAPEPGLAESYGDLRKTSGVLQTYLREIAGELRMSCENAQAIEARLRELVGLAQGDPGRSRLDAARKEVKTVIASLKSLEQVNVAIDALSEEAKGIAINTALHAGSGLGTQDDLIRLAEEVKEVAARFKDTAKRFAQVSSTMRASSGILDTIAGEPIDPPGRFAAPEEDLAGVLSRCSLWVERVVVLTDKVTNFGESYDISLSAIPEMGPDEGVQKTEPEETPVEQTAEGDEFGFESLDRSQPLFGETRESSAEEPKAGQTRERRIFGEMSPEPARPFDSADAEEGSDEEAREETGEEPGEIQRERESGRFDSPVLNRLSREPAPTQPDDIILPAGSDRFPLDEDQPDVKPAGRDTAEVDTPGDGPAETDVTHTGKDTGRSAPEDEALDLYALGAVDYDPALHG